MYQCGRLGLKNTCLLPKKNKWLKGDNIRAIPLLKMNLDINIGKRGGCNKKRVDLMFNMNYNKQCDFIPTLILPDDSEEKLSNNTPFLLIACFCGLVDPGNINYEDLNPLKMIIYIYMLTYTYIQTYLCTLAFRCIYFCTLSSFLCFSRVFVLNA